MDEIEDDFNFNLPVELTEIFRIPDATGQHAEHAAKVLIPWESVVLVEQYAFVDDWIHYKGEKFYLTLQFGQPKLIYGSYQEFKRHWCAMREKYPIFVKRQDSYGDPD